MVHVIRDVVLLCYCWYTSSWVWYCELLLVHVIMDVVLLCYCWYTSSWVWYC